MVRPTRVATVVALTAAVSCAPADAPKPPDAPATALRVAQEFVDGYYHQFPEEAFEVGYPDAPMD